MLRPRLTRANFFLLALASLLAIALLLTRLIITGQISYRFMAWNLFLAWIPLALAYAAQQLARPRLARVQAMLRALALFATAVSWLLFFPNAPYVVTDLIHFRYTGSVQMLWFDNALLGSYAVLGVALGCLSLRVMQDIVETGLKGLLQRRVPQTARQLLSRAGGWLFALLVLGLGAYGIYLGRVMRFNSWDALLNLDDLLMGIVRAFVDRPSAPGMFKITAVFLAFLLITYLALSALAITPGGTAPAWAEADTEPSAAVEARRQAGGQLSAASVARARKAR